MLSISALQQFLHDRIPLSTTMGVEVLAATPDGVTLAAPLEPNINHRDTVFGGSASAVAILSAWGLLYVRLREEFPNASIVIQRNTMSYQRPIPSAFTACHSCRTPPGGTASRTRSGARTGPGCPSAPCCTATANRWANWTPRSWPSAWSPPDVRRRPRIDAAPLAVVVVPQ